MELEVTVVSAEGLKKKGKGCLGRRMRSYAVVWVSPYDRRSTDVVPVVHRRPSWDEKFVLPVAEGAFANPTSRLTVEIYTRRLFKEKCVGLVIIPLFDIVKFSKEERATKSYDVQKRSGRRTKATLQLSIHLGEKFVVTPPIMNPEPVVAYPSTAYPPPQGYAPQAYAPQPSYPGYQPQPNYYPPMQGAPPPKRSGFGGGGMGFGTGLLAGALGGLIVGDIVDDVVDCGFDF